MECLLLGKSEAAPFLGISVRTLDALIARGEIEVKRIGRRVLIPRAELERFANELKEAR
jgi:excisionase family DNA binding protein